MSHTIKNDVIMQGDLEVAVDLTVTGDLDIGGSSLFATNIEVTSIGDLNVNSGAVLSLSSTSDFNCNNIIDGTSILIDTPFVNSDALFQTATGTQLQLGDTKVNDDLEVAGDLTVTGDSVSGLHAYHSGNQTISSSLNPVLFDNVINFGPNQSLISYSAGNFTYDVAGTYEINVSFTHSVTTPTIDFQVKLDWRSNSGSVRATRFVNWGSTTTGRREITLNHIETVSASAVRRVAGTISAGSAVGNSILGGTPGNGDGVRMNVIIKRL